MKGNSIIFSALVMIAASRTAVALDSNTVTQIDGLFHDFDHPNAPGASVMVTRNGKTLFAKGYGLANLETKAPCTTNTNFRLASVTKQFTAMSILMLVEQKKLSLDEPLTKIFPEFPAYGSNITVRHVLTHTSGLPDYEDLIPQGSTIPVLDQDVLRILSGVAGVLPSTNPPAPLFMPGAQYRYSNSGYALLALIVEARSGRTFARFLKENIFEPLKMNNTLAYEAGLSTVPNRAFGHTLRTNGWQRTDQSLTSAVLGDGGIYSSAVDLAKWDAALYGTKLVSANTLKQAFTPATPTDRPGRSYGFGWYIGEYRGLKQIWHSGESIGFRTRIVRIPEKNFCIIILANRSDVKLDEFPARIVDLILLP